MKNAVRSTRFHDCIAGTAKDAKPDLAAKNLHAHIVRMALPTQSATAAVDVIELESVQSINPVPPAACAVWFATGQMFQGSDSTISAIAAIVRICLLRMGLSPSFRPLSRRACHAHLSQVVHAY